MVDQIQFAAAEPVSNSTLINQAFPQQQTGQGYQQGYQQATQAPYQMNYQTGPQQNGQPTGYQIPQSNQLAPVTMQPQSTGYKMPSVAMQPQRTGYMQSGLTGQFAAPIQALAAQPTGRPGEWGFVRAPQGAVQGMQQLGAQMMPGAAPSNMAQQFTQNAQKEIPFAITKEEKAIYDTIHKAWDKKHQGYVEGPVAIEVFGTSGLPRPDLELIWALADTDDKGKLNSDEFAVALHLIYRKLNGYEIPPVLPPELIPPSTRNFGDSISQVKSMLLQDAGKSGPTSYMKNRSFKEVNSDYSKDGTVYKHDDAVGYVSSARRRPVEAKPAKTSDIDEIKKQIKEKQVLLDAQDEAEDDTIDRQARAECDELFSQIRKTQQKLDSHANAHMLVASDSERAELQRKLQSLVDRLPELASQVRAVERKIHNAQLAAFNATESKNAPVILGTGPNGEVTESDRRKAKTKAMMEARMAALTGKPVTKADDSTLEAASRRQAEKSAELAKVREDNEQMIKDIEESAESLRADIESALGTSKAVHATEHERRRWNDGIGVEPEVKDFIRELAQGRVEPVRKAEPERKSAPVEATRSSTPVDRSAYLKQQAEARMAERLAALGIRPTKKKDDREMDKPKVSQNNDIAQNAEKEKAERERAAQEEADRKRAEEERANKERADREQAELARRAQEEKERAEAAERAEAEKLEQARRAALASTVPEPESSDDEPIDLEKKTVPPVPSTVPSVPQAVDNNPFSKMKDSNPFAKNRPPPIAAIQPQRTNAPRQAPKASTDDWSNASGDESSSDEEGPSPADLAARLFSGGMQPQRTGTQTPVLKNSPAVRSSPAPSFPPAPPGPPPAISHPPPVPNIPPPPPMGGPPLPPSNAPPPPMGGPPAPPPMGMGGPPGPPPPPPGMPIGTAGVPPPGAADRSGLLASIQAGKGLRKVKTVEKGGASGGRVL